jgi:hypothetical protein
MWFVVSEPRVSRRLPGRRARGFVTLGLRSPCLRLVLGHLTFVGRLVLLGSAFALEVLLAVTSLTTSWPCP